MQTIIIVPACRSGARRAGPRYPGSAPPIEEFAIALFDSPGAKLGPKSLWNRLTAHMEPPVFFGSALLVVAFVVAGAVFTTEAGEVFSAIQGEITAAFGWWYMLAATGFLVLAGAILVSPLRRVRLGGADAKPEFSFLSWCAMLFAAGMGTGLVFFSVAEPFTHYIDPPPGIEARTETAAREAMRISFFHWGLNAWGIYLVLALAVAYLHFNRDLPLAPRSVLEPLFGRTVMEGWAGHAVDTLCVVGTLLGVSTSLGLGAMQINTGLNELAGIERSTLVQIILIASITALATVSVVLGVKGGIRRLSQTNLILAGLLFAFVFLAGPTVTILETFTASLGRYLQDLPRATLMVDFTGENEWRSNWTLFYWGWWISWAPFVAIFLARVSKGRTIGETIVVALLVPTLATFAWLAVFGGAGLNIERFGDGLPDIIAEEPALALHALLDTLPFAPVTMGLATLVILLFFVSSSDSGSLVDDMVTSGGDPHPPRAQRVFWAVSEGAVAIALLLAGGLTAIRNAAISLGLPMSIVLALAGAALVKIMVSERGRAALSKAD
ncbi:MAG: BCCT family transporter [Oceanicaulis sp.]